MRRPNLAINSGKELCYLMEELGERKLGFVAIKKALEECGDGAT